MSAEEKVTDLMAALDQSVKDAKEARRRAARDPRVIYRDQCRPDELCVCCAFEMGDRHAVDCHAYAVARREHDALAVPHNGGSAS